MKSALALVLLVVASFLSNPAKAITDSQAPVLEDWPFSHVNTGKHTARTVDDGLSALELRLKTIEGAKTSIDLMTFTFATDRSGSLILHALMDRVLEGVKVRILLDWRNESGRPGIDDEIVAAVQANLAKRARPENLKGSFEVRYYNRGSILKHPLKINHRNHSKLMVVDGEELIVGGRNIGDNYFNLAQKTPAYIDYEIWAKSAEQDPMKNAAAQATEAFEKYWLDPDWVSAAKPAKRGFQIKDPRFKVALSDDPKTIQAETALRKSIQDAVANEVVETFDVDEIAYVMDRPTHKTVSRILTHVVEREFEIASRYLFLEGYIFSLSKTKRKLLEEAARDRKVPIVVLTNGYPSMENPFVTHLTQSTLQELLRSSTNIFAFEFAGQPVPTHPILAGEKAPSVVGTHAKIFVSFHQEGADSFIGSYNFDGRSENYNNENGLLILNNEKFGHAVTGNLVERFDSSNELALSPKNKLVYADKELEFKHPHSVFRKVLRFLGLEGFIKKYY